MIGLPPVDPWINEIEREESAGVAEIEVGTEGTVAGIVTDTEVAEGLVPMAVIDLI